MFRCCARVGCASMPVRCACVCRGWAGCVSARVDAVQVPTPMPYRRARLGGVPYGWAGCALGWLAVYTWRVCAVGELYRHGFGFGCCVVLMGVLYLVHRKAGTT